MTGWLASVASAAEIGLVLPARPDILDLKDPASGALGAWPVERVAHAVRVLRARPAAPRISATVGDLLMEPAGVVAAVDEMATTGVDFVKVGVAPSGDPLGCLGALAPACRGGTRVVAVFFADLWGEAMPIEAAARAGLAGVMLDTAVKGRGLLSHRDAAGLARFVAEARGHGLMTGLAGSLGLADIPRLAGCGADYLGFRGALCGGRARTSAIDPVSVAEVAAAMGEIPSTALRSRMHAFPRAR